MVCVYACVCACAYVCVCVCVVCKVIRVNTETLERGSVCQGQDHVMELAEAITVSSSYLVYMQLRVCLSMTFT